MDPARFQTKKSVDDTTVNQLAPPPDSCWVLTSREAPFAIKAASDSWHALWKFPKKEAIGCPIHILQGKGTNAVAAKGLMARLRADGVSATARCTNPTKCGELRSHDLLILAHGSDLLAISANITPTHVLSAEQQADDAQVIPSRPSDQLMRGIIRDVEAATGKAAAPPGDNSPPVQPDAMTAAHSASTEVQTGHVAQWASTSTHLDGDMGNYEIDGYPAV
jgi:hypothetical protein